LAQAGEHMVLRGRRLRKKRPQTRHTFKFAFAAPVLAALRQRRFSADCRTWAKFRRRLCSGRQARQNFWPAPSTGYSRPQAWHLSSVPRLRVRPWRALSLAA
jgi:hypothetical protein